MRIFLHVVLPLLTPIIMYSVWTWWEGKRTGRGVPGWEEGHWFWVALLGVALTVASLGYLATRGGAPGDNYQAPRLENGRVVPGEFNRNQ